MFNEESGKPELTIAEQTNWRSIKGGDMDTAMEIATAYRKAEMVTINSVKNGRTESDAGDIMMAVCSKGVDIPLVEVPVSEIFIKELPLVSKIDLALTKAKIRLHYKFDEKTVDRSVVLGRLVKNMQDFKKVPPIVLTQRSDGIYETVDGQSRTGRAKRLDPHSRLRAYIIPIEYARDPNIMEEAAKNYDLLIRERGGSIIEIPKPETK